MQTTINKKMALGVPGTHGNTQPYFADVYIAGAPVTMGTAVELDSNGNVIPCATAGNAIGIAVNPNEHVNMALPSDTATLTVPAGATVAVAKKGSWYVKAVSTWAKGNKLNFAAVATATPAGLVYAASGTAAEVLDTDTATALIRFL